MRAKILGGLPWPVQIIVGYLAYNKQVRTLRGQGTGTFSAEEITEFRANIWEAINALILAAQAQSQGREGPFWLWGGDTPTEADATLFGFIVSALICDA